MSAQILREYTRMFLVSSPDWLRYISPLPTSYVAYEVDRGVVYDVAIEIIKDRSPMGEREFNYFLLSDDGGRWVKTLREAGCKVSRVAMMTYFEAFYREIREAIKEQNLKQ